MKTVTKVYVINNLDEVVNIACGADTECELAPGEGVTLEVKEGDYIYLD